jgi:hypothetical protein
MMVERAGLQIMHLGRAIELLELVSHTERGQTWRVRPLFVDHQPVEVVTIRPTDHCSRLHTHEGRKWRPGPA